MSTATPPVAAFTRPAAHWHALADRVLAGGQIDRAEALAVLASADIELLDVLALDGAVAEGDLDAFGFSGGDRVHFLDGEVHFLEDGQDFPADIACGAYDGDAIAHDEIILCSGAFGRNASAFGSFAVAKQPESSNSSPESATAFPRPHPRAICWP